MRRAGVHVGVLIAFLRMRIHKYILGRFVRSLEVLIGNICGIL
jgi:hypothetical protein